MSASKVIWYYSSHLAAFGFWSSSPTRKDHICILPIGRQIRVSFFFSDWHWCGCSCHSWYGAALFLVPEQLLLILLPLSRILDRAEWYESRKFLHTYWDSWYSSTMLLYVSKCLLGTQLPASVMKSQVSQCPFTILKTLFLLEKLAFMTVLTGLWNRLSKNLFLGHGLSPCL